MGNRTPDLFHAMEALYQLSYSPEGPATVAFGGLGADAWSAREQASGRR